MEGRSAVDPLMPDDVGASDQAGGLAVEQIHSPDTPPARVPTCEDDPASGAPLVLRHTRSMITGRYAPRQRADTAAASNPGHPGTGPSTPEADQAVVHAFGGIASSWGLEWKALCTTSITEPSRCYCPAVCVFGSEFHRAQIVHQELLVPLLQATERPYVHPLQDWIDRAK